MARCFYATVKNQEFEIILDPRVQQSYINTSLAQELEEEFDIKVDTNGEYFFVFHLNIENRLGENENIYMDLTILEDDECQYQICLGNDFLSSDLIDRFTENTMEILSIDGYDLMSIQIYEC